ncbi:MAG TPA: NAD(P)H-dependent oxidoreductase subunit E [Tepidisphaeraceae bacterium]|nr:NAD(P)H-dependent oxidoreductase subunit E [Tepidisphaeraceae bacterium]
MTALEQQPATVGRHFQSVCKALDRYNHEPSRLIPILQAIQDEYRYLPEDVLTYVATALGVPPSRVYGVATFFAHFALEAKGKYVVRLCDGTACHVKQSIPILEAIRQKLGLSEKKKTTPDMLFTVETVACLGACGLAPAMVINDDVHGQCTPESALKIISEIQIGEQAKSNGGVQ